MNEHPILFSGPMVRAILEGRKTQTRRVVKPQPPTVHNFAGFTLSSTHRADEGKAVWASGDVKTALHDAHRVRCPYGQPGDRLWVRETWAHSPRWYVYKANFNVSDGFGASVLDLNTGEIVPLVWKPSIHMPRKACRLMLEVVSVRVERVQDISEQDAWAEGIEHIACDLPYSGDDLGRLAFSGLWESINGPRGFGWHVNPWVWVVEFKVA